jgi:hypothetical protein
VTYRSYLLDVGIDRVFDHPVLGYGFGSMTNGRNEILMYGNLLLTDVANMPLAIALEMGLFGLACIGALTFLSVRYAFTHRRDAFGATGFIAGVVAAMVTSAGVMTVMNLALLLFMLGLFSAASPGAPPRRDQPATNRGDQLSLDDRPSRVAWRD